MMSTINIFWRCSQTVKRFYLLLNLSVKFEQVKLCIDRKKFVMTDSKWKKMC